MRIRLLILTALALAINTSAQDTALLTQRLAATKSVREKVLLIDTVAYLFMLYTDKDSIAEVYGKRALDLAKTTNDNELIALALHLNARRTWWDATNKQYRNERFKYYVAELIKIAKASGLPAYEAAANHLVGTFHLIHYEQSDALRKLQYALLLADESGNDSLKAEIYSSLGSVFTSTADKVIAFKHFMLGLQHAEKAQSDIAAGSVRRDLASFYKSIGDTAKAIQQYLLSQQHLMKHRDKCFEQIFWNNIEISDLYTRLNDYEAARKYVDEIFTWQGKQYLPPPFVTHAHIAIYFSLFNAGKYDESTAYYRAHPEIAKLVETWKVDYLDYYFKAIKFGQMNMLDSSAFYFEKYVIPSIKNVQTDPRNFFDIFMEYGQVLMKRNEPAKARQQFEKGLTFAKTMNLPETYRDVYQQLHQSTADMGDFRNAYHYLHLVHKYSDSITNLSKQREVMQLDVANEAARQIQQQKAEELRIRTRHNLQYMAITVIIATVFAILMMLGFFTTSAPIIRALGFLAVIMLFEFIILIGDNYIHQITHGEPWRVLAIKIGVIAVLFPLHHYVEHRIVRHLINRRKINLRAIMFRKSKPGAPANNEPADADTSVAS